MALPIMALSAGASLLSGLLGSSAASKAAKAQAAAAQKQLDLQSRMYDEGTNRLAPFVQGGARANEAYMSELGLGAAPAGYEAYDMGKFKTDPGYKFRMSQGLDAVQSSAAARGGLYSGAAMTGVNNYAQGQASQEYGNWYNRAYGGQQDYYNRLAGLASNGQNAASGQAALGANYANAGSNALANQGNALSAGAIGSANAWSDALQNGIASYGYLKSLG